MAQKLTLGLDKSDQGSFRRRSIVELAPPTMTVAEAQAWAAKLTPSGMERKLRELEVWVAELGSTVAGWGPFAATDWRGFTPTRNSPAAASAEAYWKRSSS